ncbi:MAG: VOC family protein [Solirubrobacterales bacterium]|nr:VOC family protein [Solirubrobacterales bacterium]
MALRAFPVLYAADVSRLAGFYARLGFEERFRLPASDGSPGYVLLGRDASELGVVDEVSPRQLAGVEPGPGSRHEMFVYVEDVDATVGELRERGVEVVREPVDMPWGERVAFVRDPEGNLVSLAAPATAAG